MLHEDEFEIIFDMDEASEEGDFSSALNPGDSEDHKAMIEDWFTHIKPGQSLVEFEPEPSTIKVSRKKVRERFEAVHAQIQPSPKHILAAIKGAEELHVLTASTERGFDSKIAEVCVAIKAALVSSQAAYARASKLSAKALELFDHPHSEDED